MRDTPETIANDCIVQSVAQGGYLDENALRAAIAAAIEKDRAETIERCAKVAEEYAPHTTSAAIAAVTDEVCENIASAMRRPLSTPPRAEP